MDPHRRFDTEDVKHVTKTHMTDHSLVTMSPEGISLTMRGQRLRNEAVVASKLQCCDIFCHYNITLGDLLMQGYQIGI